MDPLKESESYIPCAVYLHPGLLIDDRVNSDSSAVTDIRKYPELYVGLGTAKKISAHTVFKIEDNTVEYSGLIQPNGIQGNLKMDMQSDGATIDYVHWFIHNVFKENGLVWSDDLIFSKLVEEFQSYKPLKAAFSYAALKLEDESIYTLSAIFNKSVFTVPLKTELDLYSNDENAKIRFKDSNKFVMYKQDMHDLETRLLGEADEFLEASKNGLQYID